MTTPVLFYDPTSEPCRAVYWMCVASGVPVALEYIWLTRNEHMSDRLLAVNPFHQVPALEHDGFVLSEATAIMQYLADWHGCTEDWFGEGRYHQAEINRLLSWYHTNLRTVLTLNYFLPCLLMPKYLGFSVPVDTQDRLDAVGDVLAKVTLLLGDKPYLSGDAVSAADLLYASEIIALAISPAKVSLLPEHSPLAHWMQRLESVKGYAQSHGPWQHIVPKLLTMSCAEDSGPGWVADECEQAIAKMTRDNQY